MENVDIAASGVLMAVTVLFVVLAIMKMLLNTRPQT